MVHLLHSLLQNRDQGDQIRILGEWVRRLQTACLVYETALREGTPAQAQLVRQQSDANIALLREHLALLQHQAQGDLRVQIQHLQGERRAAPGRPPAEPQR